MDDGSFQWDDNKAAQNYAAHGVTFEAAREAFSDPFALDWPDESEPTVRLGTSQSEWAEGRLLFVAYTLRGDAIRIISARGAEPYERRKYHEENR